MVSWLPHITSFCCCLGLEAGAKFVGFLHLVSSLLLVVVCAYFSVQFKAYIGTTEDEPDNVYGAWYQIAVGITFLSTCHVLLSFTLLYGVYKRNTTCLRAWVYVMLVLFVAALVYILVVTIKFGFSSSGSEIFLTFSEGLLFFCVLAYFIVCINSFYMMVKSSEDMEGPKYNY